MERYLIETPHTAVNCLVLIEEVHAQGYLNNFDWVAEPVCILGGSSLRRRAESRARMAVPPTRAHTGARDPSEQVRSRRGCIFASEKAQ